MNGFIGTRTPRCVVVKSVVSTSGKYRLFYGHHYCAGVTCFDCGTINNLTGEIITRHYEMKAEALRAYHDFEKGLTKPADTEEREVNDPRIADAFRRALEGK